MVLSRDLVTKNNVLGDAAKKVCVKKVTELFRRRPERSGKKQSARTERCVGSVGSISG